MPSLIGDFRRGVLLLLAVALWPSLARAEQGGQASDRVSFGHDITVREGETVGDVVCAFCGVRVEGDVKGDVAVFFGRVAVERGHSIAGDIALFGGKVKLAAGTTVGGDVAIFGGSIDADDEAAIRGDRVVLPGILWLLGLALAPFLVLGGAIWLVVWLVRRPRYAAPLVRRF